MKDDMYKRISQGTTTDDDAKTLKAVHVVSIILLIVVFVTLVMK